MQRILTVVHTEESLDEVLAAVRSLDFDPELPDASGELAAVQEEAKPWWPLMTAGVLAVTSEAVGWFESTLLPEWTAAALALTAIVMCGGTTYKRLGCPEERQYEHQCPDEHCGDRCGDFGRVAGSGHGDGAVYHC
ncbi:hypothetical protein [Aliamphritea spongicola]